MNSSLDKPLRQATLCLLVKNNQVLLAMKKRGFGQGKWNGVGGKPQEGETVEDAAIRETQEEIGVIPKSLQQVATLNFTFPDTQKDWNQQVLVYLVNSWEGEPQESEEMAPQWFEKEKIPFEKMWSDDIHWLPKVLAGTKLTADFHFNQNQQLLNFSLLEDI